MTEVPLSPFNSEVVHCFKDFIKYNAYLLHLNLQTTGLIDPSVKFIASLLRKSQALSSLHLCDNKVAPETVDWIRSRIHARPKEDHFIKPYKANKLEEAKALEQQKNNPLFAIFQLKREQSKKMEN